MTRGRALVAAVLALSGPAGAGELLYPSGASGTLDILRLGSAEPVAGGPAMEHWASPGPDGCRFAFFSTRDGDREIYIGFLDGRAPVRLTRDPAEDLNPAWSPDGSRIAFFSTRDGGGLVDRRLMGRVYVMSADGSGVRPLADELIEVTSVAWAADGRQLLYAADTAAGREIVARPAEGGEARVITHETANGVSPGHPAPSPDGRWLAFHVQADGRAELRLMRLGEGGVETLGGAPGLRYSPEWSPDSRRIAYTFSPDGSNFDLREMDVGSREERTLLATPANERAGRWLPRDCNPADSGDREQLDGE